MERTKLGRFTNVLGWVFAITFTLSVIENLLSCAMQGVYESSFFSQVIFDRTDYLFQFFFGPILLALFLIPVYMMGVKYRRMEEKKQKAIGVWLMVLSLLRAFNDALYVYFYKQRIIEVYMDKKTEVFLVCGVLAYLIFGIAMVIYLKQPDDYERFFALVIFGCTVVNAVYTFGVVYRLMTELGDMLAEATPAFYLVVAEEVLSPVSLFLAMILFPLWLVFPEKFVVKIR